MTFCECVALAALLCYTHNFLETRGDYLLTEDGYYVVKRKPTVMHGLGLSDDVLENIYRQNFLDFIRKN